MSASNDPLGRTMNLHTPSGAVRGAQADLPPPPSDPLEALAARLAEEMALAWQQGERPRAEDYLARHPELNRCPAAAAQLIYEEVCLREQDGEDHATTEVLRRFPQWRDELEVLLECHRLFRSEAAPPSSPLPARRWESCACWASWAAAPAAGSSWRRNRRWPAASSCSSSRRASTARRARSI
jgi:hypothetical protein